MKKLKLILMPVVIVLAIGTALATTTTPDCSDEVHYFRMSTPWGCYFWPAGEEGIDYTCVYLPAYTCTWYQPSYFGGDVYFPCERGQFVSACW